MTENPETRGFWTIPNLICLFRFLGVGPLIWAAYQGHRDLFFWIMVVLLLSDWLDGKLAGILDQRTVLGARLDSGVDALMYGAAGLSLWWLEEEAIRNHLVLILAVVGSWGLSAGVGLIRFQRLPSYHMWSAKVSWFWVALALLALLLLENPILMPLALGLVVFANLHAVAISLTLPHWKADVWSLRQAWRIRQGQEEPGP